MKWIKPHKIAIVLENQSAYPNTVHVMRQLKSVAHQIISLLVVIYPGRDLEHPLDESPNAETFIFAKYSATGHN